VEAGRNSSVSISGRSDCRASRGTDAATAGGGRSDCRASRGTDAATAGAGGCVRSDQHRGGAHREEGEEGGQQLELDRVRKTLWPPDGIVPPEYDPSRLLHAAEDLYKREADEKSKATGKKEAPRKPASWPTYKRYLNHQRGT